VKRVKVLLVLLLAGVLLVSGCLNTGSKTETSSKVEDTAGGHSSSVPSVSTSTNEQTQTEETTSPRKERPKGILTTKIFNKTFAVNASLVPDSTFDCLSKGPDVIRAYYSAVKSEKNVSDFFDLSVVEESSLLELHEALYRAVDFKELQISEPNCSVISTNLVACSYHYHAVLIKEGQEKTVERDYVTFLSGDVCKIVWTEAES